MVSMGKFTKMFKVGMEYTMLQTMNQVINSQPNVPSTVKVLTGITTTFLGYEILDNAMDALPPSIRGIGKTLNKMQAAVTAIQQVPNMINAINSFGRGDQVAPNLLTP